MEWIFCGVVKALIKVGPIQFLINISPYKSRWIEPEFQFAQNKFSHFDPSFYSFCLCDFPSSAFQRERGEKRWQSARLCSGHYWEWGPRCTLMLSASFLTCVIRGNMCWGWVWGLYLLTN